ncbi:uncharacterized protein LOC116804994 [Drosophila grimshawi]|uniref:uncharacterized protein LOC116804994 n=1 Tax=Drosophila grimshawi TaxID=7222 RepID=UPI000C86E938|nr:uncharacterized protein LOC116804994 [Drosophila grimshawi]
MNVKLEDSPRGVANRARELETKRLLYWSRQLNILPEEVQRLSREELQQRNSLVQQSEEAHQMRREQFKRWQNLNELRWLMYEEQRKYNEKCGNEATDASIWHILSLAQRELETELQMPELWGSCQRFPSPMSVMETEREVAGRNDMLTPVKSIITGLNNGQSSTGKKLGGTPIKEKQQEQKKMEQVEQKVKTQIKLEKQASSSSSIPKIKLASLNGSGIQQDSFVSAEDLCIRHELNDIKHSTVHWDSMIQMLFEQQQMPSNETNILKLSQSSIPQETSSDDSYCSLHSSDSEQEPELNLKHWQNEIVDNQLQLKSCFF